MEGGVYRPPSAVLHFLQNSRGQDYLSSASNLVSQYKGKSYKLSHPAGAKWTIGGLEETIYKDMPKVVNGWGKFYLSQEVCMQVVGVVEGTSCPSDQLVLMICETGEMYAYADEELHMVASSLDQLCEEGMEFPSSKRYYDGEAFKYMTKDDWDKVKKSKVGRRLDEEHRKLVASRKDRFVAKFRASCEHPILHSTAGKQCGEVLECGAAQAVGVKRGCNHGESQSSQWREVDKIIQV